MTILVQCVLMVFAASAFAGSSSCAALQQHKVMQEGTREAGLGAVTVLLGVFGAMCAGAAGGTSAILAVALPSALFGYTVTARRSGLFSIQTGEVETHYTEGSELHT